MTGHLIHVGFPKTGSKFLQRWFREHPQLGYSEGTLGGYRDVYQLVRECVAPRPGMLYRITSDEEFTAPRPDAGKIAVAYGDRIDLTIAQENVCALLADLFPNAHVLIVTRGYRSMLFSWFSQYARCGGDTPFEELLANAPGGHPWNYDRVIGMYQRAFGEDKVMVTPYELLRDDVDRFTRTLEEWLGLEHFVSAPDRLNTSLSPVELYWYPRITRAVRRLPIGSRLKQMYVHAAFVNRFRRPIAILQRLRPGTPVTAASFPEELWQNLRGCAEALRSNPLYAPYANEYLLD